MSGRGETARQPGGNLAARLRGAVHRIEALEQEIAALNRDKSDVFRELKAAGIDPAGVRAALRYRRDPAAAEERDTARDEVLRLLDEAERPSRRAAAPALPAPNPVPVIDLKADGTEDATRVHVHARAEDERQTDLEEFTGRAGGRQ